MREDGIQGTGDRCQVTGKEPPFLSPRPSPTACRHAARCTLHASSPRGFTLVEILVAIAILAVVLSTIYVSYLSTMRIVKSLEYGDEIYYMARITLERMVLDLQSACKEKDAYEFSTIKDSTGRLPFRGVSFLSRAHLDFSGPGDSMAVAQISYELEGDPESGGFSIVRRDVLRQGQGRGAAKATCCAGGCSSSTFASTTAAAASTPSGTAAPGRRPSAAASPRPS